MNINIYFPQDFYFFLTGVTEKVCILHLGLEI